VSPGDGVLTFRSKNKALAQRAVEILEAERPMTLRQLYYRLISAGVLANAQKEYKRLGNVMTTLREVGSVPRTWIVDHVRSTLKPSSWSGLADFAETVREAYRKDFWASLPHHVEVFVEKDAIAGTVQPVTAEFDVGLRVCRGYASVSFAGEIADLWAEVEKPIFAYYLGDYDPSGFDIERDLREKLARYSALHCHPVNAELTEWHGEVQKEARAGRGGSSGGYFFWVRLAVRAEDFEGHGLIELPVKMKDQRARGFIGRHGRRCAEVDALPPTELRRRVREAIVAHIDTPRWERLQETERLEQETLNAFIGGLGPADRK
jgi:hypothetical protein